MNPASDNLKSPSMPPPPLPLSDEVLITGERAKLPPAVAALVDADTPIPPSVKFFQERITFRSIASSLMWSAVLAVVGVICIVFGIALFFDHTNVTVSSSVDWMPLLFGVTCAFAAWFMFIAAGERRRLRRLQSAGGAIRVGIFVTDDAIVEAAATTFTVIPRSALKGVDGGAVKYLYRGQEKSTRLPREYVGAETRIVEGAIRELIAQSPMTRPRLEAVQP